MLGIRHDHQFLFLPLDDVVSISRVFFFFFNTCHKILLVLFPPLISLIWITNSKTTYRAFNWKATFPLSSIRSSEGNGNLKPLFLLSAENVKCENRDQHFIFYFQVIKLEQKYWNVGLASVFGFFLGRLHLYSEEVEPT